MNETSIKIGSRESLLAVKQAEIIIERIKKAAPYAQTELITMKTTGDMIQNRPLDLIGGKGLFVKELDMALLDGRCDLTVHSLKDMPMETSARLPLRAFSCREDARDVLILRAGLHSIPAAPVIGTGSRRRSLQAAALFPEARFQGIRGNIQTRLAKLDSGAYDALIMAAAGLIRLGLTERIYRYFTTEEIIPPAGQGILAVQGRAEDTYDFLEKLNCKESELSALAERSFVRTLDGGCSSPIAAYACMEQDRLVLKGLYYSDKTGRYITGTMEGDSTGPEELGRLLALELKRKLDDGE